MTSSRRTRLVGLARACVVAAVVAFDVAGQSRWARTYGGPGMGELIHAVGEMAGGDLVIAASTDSYGTTTGDAWLIRLDAAGNVLSQSVVGNALPGGVDGAVVLPDGGAVFASRNVRDLFTMHDALFVRVDSTGTPVWVTQVAARGGGTGRFFVNDVVALSDGTFLGVGQASLSDAGPFVGWLVRLDASGTVLWQQYHGGVIGIDVSFESGIQTADGGFAVTGWATGGAGGEDVFVAKTTSTGAISWTQQVGGPLDDAGAAIVEIRGGGGYAIAGWTNSFMTSAHSAWVVRLDSVGAITWTEALGDTEWSDLQAITQASDQDLVVLGRLGDATNDLWAAKIGQGTATVLWQRRYAGTSGDYAAEIAELGGGDLLLAGTWAWGFPEEDLWLLRTDADGQIPGCSLVVDTRLMNSAPRYVRSTPLLPPYPPFGTASAGSVVTGTSALTMATQCAVVSCPTLACDSITASPDPACEGTLQVLTLATSGGTSPVTVDWDLDGDTTPDASGNPASVSLPVGTTTVTAFATDGCAPTPETCSLSRDVTVLSSVPPGDVSDVLAGAVPLLVLDHGARVSFEDRPDAVAYNLYADTIGSWYAPNAAAGSACFVVTTPGGPGRLEAAPSLATNTWVVVTGSSRCAEGSAGRDSFGVGRMTVGTWSACGPGP